MFQWQIQQKIKENRSGGKIGTVYLQNYDSDEKQSAGKPTSQQWPPKVLTPDGCARYSVQPVILLQMEEAPLRWEFFSNRTWNSGLLLDLYVPEWKISANL